MENYTQVKRHTKYGTHGTENFVINAGAEIPLNNTMTVAGTQFYFGDLNEGGN